MEKVNRAVFGVVCHQRPCGIGRGLTGCIPVFIRAVPEDTGIAHFADKRQGPVAGRAFRETEQFHGITVLGQDVVVKIQDLVIPVLQGNGREGRMPRTVVANGMPLVDHSFHRSGILFGKVHCDEEDRFHIFLFENIQDLIGIVVVFISFVKGEVDHIPVAIPRGVSVILGIVTLPFFAAFPAVALFGVVQLHQFGFHFGGKGRYSACGGIGRRYIFVFPARIGCFRFRGSRGGFLFLLFRLLGFLCFVILIKSGEIVCLRILLVRIGVIGDLPVF